MGLIANAKNFRSQRPEFADPTRLMNEERRVPLGVPHRNSGIAGIELSLHMQVLAATRDRQHATTMPYQLITYGRAHERPLDFGQGHGSL
jgi:hypothetical protein